MKKSFLLLVLAAAAGTSTGKEVKSSIRNVTVFTQGAQVFRSADVSFPAGTTELVFTALSPFLQPASIQAGGKGDFIILDAVHSIRYPEPPQEQEQKASPEILRRISLTQDSLTELGFGLDELSEKRDALLLEKNMIQKNKLAQGEGKSDSLAVLKQAMDFFRLKLADINAQLIRIRRDELKLQKQKEEVTNRLTALQTFRNNQGPDKKYEPIHEVTVTVSASQAGAGVITLSYLVSNAGWTPSYDLRSSGTASPVDLTYKANVYQDTKEDWKNVSLRLSTSNPNRGSTKPELPVWYINYFYPRYPETTTSAAPSMSRAMDEKEYDLQKKMDSMSAAQSAANYSQIVESMTTVEFDISLPYSIPADGQRHLIAVQNKEMPASYMHYLVPRLDDEAFLVARVTGWEEMSLLPGPANIFFEGTYVGQAMLNPAILDDTLNLSMGRDHGITVSRKRQPVKEKNTLLGNEMTRVYTYELKMKSIRANKISLVVEDQVPVTQNKDIKIEVRDTAKADYNPTTGMLKWDLVLAARESKSFSFSYAVTSQKGMPLSMQ